MPTRVEMRGLAQDIIRSYEDRIAGIAQLKSDVSTMLKGFDRDHAAMSREMKADLAKGVADLAAMSREMKADLAKGVADLKRDVATMLNGLAKGVADLKRDVATMLNGFDKDHAAMSKEMKADLAKGVADRKRDVATMKADLAKGVADRKRDVGTMLKRFDAELNKVRTMLAEARDEWRKLTAIMQAKRGIPLVEKLPVVVAPEVAELTDRVFVYLADHPDGTRLTELEEEFGVARIQMARVIRSLMDENKVEKRDLLYFAI